MQTACIVFHLRRFVVIAIAIVEQLVQNMNNDQVRAPAVSDARWCAVTVRSLAARTKSWCWSNSFETLLRRDQFVETEGCRLWQAGRWRW